jgi:UDP-N-acetylglucosamine kinase
VTDRLTAADFPVSAAQTAGILHRLLARMDADFVPSVNPQLMFVTGQPAAGKSRTVDQLSSSLDVAPVVLDSDVLRLLHPAMPSIIAADPQRMDVLSNGPVGEWMSGSISHAREAGYNVIIENTLTNPAQVAETAAAFHQAGYQVNVAALAVPAEDSRLGIVQRYIAGLDNDPYPRWTTERSHSSAYTGMIDGLEQVTGVVDSIEVFTRNGESVYDGADGAAAAAAVTEHRAVPKTTDELAAWTAGYLGVVDRLTAPGMITDQTRTVIRNLLHDADRNIDLVDLPDAHLHLHGLVFDAEPSSSSLTTDTVPPVAEHQVSSRESASSTNRDLGYRPDPPEPGSSQELE